MKKNNTAEKAILTAKEMSNAIKEGTEKTLRSIMNESISEIIKADDDEEEKDENVDTKELKPNEDDSFEVEDVDDEVIEKDKEEKPEDGGEKASEDENPEDETEDEWAELNDYKIGDNDYDFTGVDGDTILKVYNKLNDDDEIFVKKEDDGTYSFKDSENNAEYVIELEPEGDKDDIADDAEDNDDDDIEIDLDDDDETNDDDDVIEVDLDDETEDNVDDETEDETESEFEINFDDETDDEDDDVKMVAECGTTKTVEGCDTENCDELKENQTTSKSQKRKAVKTLAPNAGEKEVPYTTKKTSIAGDYIAESFLRKANEIQAENKKYKKALATLKESLTDAAILNVNYGKIVNLLVNESTTKKEKLDIIKRFQNAKTIQEGTQLYNTIKSELKESKKSSLVLEKQISANPSKQINETTIYSTKETNPALDLMSRMDNLYK